MTADADTLLSVEEKWSRVGFPFAAALRTLLHSLPGQGCSHPFCSSKSSPCSQQAPASRAGSCQGTLPGRAQCHAHRGYELALVALPAGCSREGLGGVLRVHRAQLVPYRAAVYGAEQTANSKGHLSQHQAALLTLHTDLGLSNTNPSQTQQVPFSATAKSYQYSILYLQCVKEGKSTSQGHVFGIWRRRHSPCLFASCFSCSTASLCLLL